MDLHGGSCYPSGGGGLTPFGSEIQIYANGTLIFDSGCVTGDNSYTVTVPAGTTSLHCVGTASCDITCTDPGDLDESVVSIYC